MARTHTAAISIQRHQYAESSQIVHFLTEDDGRVAVLARGSFRQKNSYQGPIDLLVNSTVRYRRSPERELGTLTRRTLRWVYPGLRDSLTRFRCAAEMLSLIVETTPVGQGDPLLFRLFDRGLRTAETLTAARLPLLVLSFQLRLLSLNGVAPSLAVCVRCGSAGNGSARSWARFVVAEGGAVCSGCRREASEGLALSRGVSDFLMSVSQRRLADVTMPPREVLGRAETLVRRHAIFHLERPERLVMDGVRMKERRR